MGKVIFPCGCEFNRVDGGEDFSVTRVGEEFPLLTYDHYTETNMDCDATWTLLQEGRTVGVFQLESRLGHMWTKRISPDNLEMYGALMALLRPGCLKATSGDPPKSMTQRYKDRRHKAEEVEFFDVEELKPILESTYGVLVYQEQAMRIAVVLAGFNEQEADVLRKAIGKKKPEIMAQVEKGFLTGCAKKSIVNSEKAKEIFSWIRESQRYSFNLSHAILYGLDSFWSAYCKAHFPIQFFCSYMRGADWKQDKYEEVNILVSDAKTMGIYFHCPDFRDQEDLCYIKDNEIYFGMFDIRDVGEAAVEKILLQTIETSILLGKKVKDWSWLDYLIYFSTRVSTTASKALINSGALDYFGEPRNKMMFEFEKIQLLSDKERLWVYSQQYGKFSGDDDQTEAKWTCLYSALVDCGHKKKDGGGCHNARRVDIVTSAAHQLLNPPHSLEDTPDMIVWCEERYLGTSLTTNAVEACDESFKANATCLEAQKDRGSHYMVLAVEIVRLNEYVTKKGKNPGRKMAFLTVRDSSCSLDDVLCFPGEWKLYKDKLFEENTVLIQVQKMKGGGFSIQKVAQI